MLGTLKDGMQAAGVALILERKEGTTKTGNAYLDLALGDKFGSLDCKLWGYIPELHGPLKQGSVVNVTITTSTYNGQLQGKIGTISLSDVDPTSLVKGSRFNVDVMGSEVLSYVTAFTEPLTKRIAEELLTAHWLKFLVVPAATGQHNNWPGGLVEHVWSMCQLATPIIDHYQTKYKKFSKDKVLFGIIIHDLGKVVEYDTDGITSKYTPEGILVPHIVTAIGWVYSRANAWYLKNPDAMTMGEFVKERNQLVHLVASHHGKEEWGSPVKPATLEAILLHQIDMIDSKFMHALGLIEGKPGELEGFSEKSWTEKTSYMLYNAE